MVKIDPLLRTVSDATFRFKVWVDSFRNSLWLSYSMKFQYEVSYYELTVTEMKKLLFFVGKNYLLQLLSLVTVKKT